MKWMNTKGSVRQGFRELKDFSGFLQVSFEGFEDLAMSLFTAVDVTWMKNEQSVCRKQNMPWGTREIRELHKLLVNYGAIFIF